MNVVVAGLPQEATTSTAQPPTGRRFGGSTAHGSVCRLSPIRIECENAAEAVAQTPATTAPNRSDTDTLTFNRS